MTNTQFKQYSSQRDPFAGGRSEWPDEPTGSNFDLHDTLALGTLASRYGGRMQDIKTVIREFLLDNFVMGSDAVIADDVSFMKTHILDSTGFIELVTFIEETFGITVADEEMVPENLDSLLNIEAYLERKGATLAIA